MNTRSFSHLSISLPLSLLFSIVIVINRALSGNTPTYQLFFPLVQYPPAIATTTRVSVSQDGAEANLSSSTCFISATGQYIVFDTKSSNLVPDDTNGYSDIFVRDQQTEQLALVSVAFDGTQANESSLFPSISADGRFVVFQSYASNLVTGDTNQSYDIFLHDRQTAQISRLSVAPDGTQGDSSSYTPMISADGRYVTFWSFASNLVPNDNNEVEDVFVYDRLTAEITRVALASDGTEGNAPSAHPSISADGRYVAFQSDATNLINNDTNSWTDIFVHDRLTEQTTRVSVGPGGTEANGRSLYPSISSDGRYVAFYSFATHLLHQELNNPSGIFVHDRQLAQTILASVASDGTHGNGSSYNPPMISGNGRFVVFESLASNLVNNDTNDERDIMMHDLWTGETTLVSVASDGTQGNQLSNDPHISDDGQYVVFASLASNLVSHDTNWVIDIFVRDRGQ